MPRKPTGNPRGRPPGTGTLGEQTRFTVRIPTDLYDRLEAFAEGRSFTHGTPQLAGCVRELLEHALVCPYKRQTKNIPLPVDDNKRQTENITETGSPALGAVEDEKRQTIIVPPLPVQPVEPQYISQPINEHAETEAVLEEGLADAAEDKRQTEKRTSAAPVPSFDPGKYALGKLCPRGHDYHGTGKTLLRLPKYVCPQCDAERARERRQAKRQAQPA